jgi:hypothetical protein
MQTRYLSEKKRDAMNSAAVVERDMRHHGETPELLKEYEGHIGRADEFTAEINARRNAPQSTNLPIETVIDWMREQDGKFVNAPPVKVSAPKGFSAAVNEERAVQADIRGRIAETNRRPLPQSEAEARLKEDVCRMALPLQVASITRLHQQLRGIATSTVERPKKQGNVVFPTRREIFDGGRAGELDEAFRFLCWLVPDAIIAKGKAELATLYKTSGPGLSVAERESIVEGLKAELLESERREEALIRAADDCGEIIWRRPNASPEAVLGVVRKV